jgi:hypothetical protein
VRLDGSGGSAIPLEADTARPAAQVVPFPHNKQIVKHEA